MIDGALYAMTFHKGIRLFVYDGDHGDKFLYSGQKNILKPRVGNYKSTDCDTWKFHELENPMNGVIVTLRLATSQEEQDWYNYWSNTSSPEKLRKPDNNHYQIY